MTTRATVEVWLERLSETVSWGTNKRLRSDDERIVRLWEALVGLVGETVLKGYYFDFLNSEPGRSSLQSLGIAFLMDAYDMREFDASENARLKVGSSVDESLDNRIIMAREVWRRGEVRKQIVHAVRLVIDDEAAPNEWTMDPKTRQVVTDLVRLFQLNPMRARELNELPKPKGPPPCAPPTDYVTLKQVAAYVRLDKSTLEKWKDKPSPKVVGGSGKANFWLWSELRPYLAEKTGRPMPEVFPAHTAELDHRKPPETTPIRQKT